ncbi:RHS repeat-associated core domain-containing protein [Dyella sp. EPa41]|uniref:RHS repeat-associated core domain-containing protein n=1 Tax=Dyella sp. EPa41 TaxID=1561194 RepID=UPI0019159400|nr:RHS repeat-associated core domain-containing protein [Dyella sp. EPa41]
MEFTVKVAGRLGCVSLFLMGVCLSGQANAGTVTYIYTDPQGTPLSEADTNGNVIANFDYRPYGSNYSGAGMAATPSGPGYTGHVSDPDTALIYMQARYYDPAIGRFFSADPIGPLPGDPFNFNRFQYANGNPGRNTDPTGACTGSLFCEFHNETDKQRNSELAMQEAGIAGVKHQNEKPRVQASNTPTPQANNRSRGGGVWQGLKERSSFTADGAAAFGPGVDVSATKEVGKSPDSLGGTFVIGEGAIASATYNLKVWSGSKESSNGIVFQADPSSYLKVKLGSGLALGFVFKTDVHGASDLSISVGAGIGEEVIYKPPVSVGGNYNIPK